MQTKEEVMWEARKSELLDSIDAVLEKTDENKEVLEIMKELINYTKVVNTMGEYYEKEI